MYSKFAENPKIEISKKYVDFHIKPMKKQAKLMLKKGFENYVCAAKLFICLHFLFDRRGMIGTIIQL